LPLGKKKRRKREGRCGCAMGERDSGPSDLKSLLMKKKGEGGKEGESHSPKKGKKMLKPTGKDLREGAQSPESKGGKGHASPHKPVSLNLPRGGEKNCRTSKKKKASLHARKRDSSSEEGGSPKGSAPPTQKKLVGHLQKKKIRENGTIGEKKKKAQY